MNKLKNIIVVGVILLTLLVLVILRSTNKNLFKQDVNSAIEKAKDGSNLLSAEELKVHPNSFLVINLDKVNTPKSWSVEKVIAISPENILDENNRKILKEVNGDLILYSAEAAKSAKVWVILNQLGFQKVYILTAEANPEVLKYKFQPDTTARLEEVSE